MNEPAKNLNATYLGIGEFSFSPGAATRAEARAKGYRDIGNIQAFTPEIENTKEEHEGSYRTGKRVDKVFSTKQKIEYVIRSDELNAGQIQMLLMASDPVGDNAAGALTQAAGDSMDFTASPSIANRWYELFVDDARRTGLTSVLFASSPANAVVADPDAEDFTDAAHGLSNGDAIFFQAAVMPTGLTAGTIYYVINAATDDFQVALTPGGAAVTISTAGTTVTWLPALVEDTDFEVDLRLGRVRFLTEQTGTVYPYITAPAIAEGDTAYMRKVRPMENPTFEGYGRLVVFDPEQSETTLLDHHDFSCTVTVERAGEIDGKKPAEVTIRVTVTGDEGEVLYPDYLS